MELPEVQRARGGVDIHEVVRSAARGCSRSVEVRRQEAVESGGKLEAHARRSSGATQHGITVKRARFRSNEIAAILKNIPCDVIGVRPHPDFGIVVDAGSEAIGPHVIGAGWVWRF